MSSKTRTKRHYTGWATYIRKILKQVHPDQGIGSEALGSVEALIDDSLAQIVSATNALVARGDRKTLDSRLVQAAVRLCIPGELAKHAVSEGTKAVEKYVRAGSGARGASRARAKRAGLQLSVSRVEHAMMKHSSLCRKAELSAVYLAAVLEYLTAEVLELAGNSARDRKRSRVASRDILRAVRNDEELNKLYAYVVLPGGVVPHIHHQLLPKKKGKKKGKR